MSLVNFFSFIVLSTAFSAHADFEVIQQFHQIKNPDEGGTWVVLDLDENVMEPVAHLGSMAWYNHLVNQLRERKNISEPEAHRQAMKVWNRLQRHLKMKFVDPLFLEWMQSRTQARTPVLSLTARWPETEANTVRQLLELGVDFSSTRPSVSLESFRSEEYSWQQGILFSRNYHAKGNVLLHFMRSITHPPKRILVVDNLSYHLHALDVLRSEFANAGIDLVLYHLNPTTCATHASTNPIAEPDKPK